MSFFLLANDFNDIYEEIDKIEPHKYNDVFYVYTERDLNINLIRNAFPNFKYIHYSNLLDTVRAKTVSRDAMLIVSHIKISKVPDMNLGVLQRSRCRKLVIDNHPFMSNSQTYYLYFPYSIIDKTKLRYPHSYAFRDAPISEGNDPFDVKMLVRRVSGITKTYIDHVFDIDKINFTEIPLSHISMDGYQKLKDSLFESENTSYAIISNLKRFADKQLSEMGISSDYNLLYPNRAFDLYSQGKTNCTYSNAKVDLYLLQEFKKYIESVNTFCRTLWEIQNGD